MKKLIYSVVFVILLLFPSVLLAADCSPLSYTCAEMDALFALVDANAIIAQSDCSGITSGICQDTDDGALYYYDENATAVHLIGYLLGLDNLSDVTGEGNAGYLLKDDGDGTYSFTNSLTGLTFGGFTASRGVTSDGSGNLQSATPTDSIVWNAAGMSADGTQCADPAEVTINSGPKMYTVICADNDGSTLYGHTIMPDGWDAGTVTFELEYLQTAADTNVLNSDIAAMCRGATETVNNTWGTEVAIDDAAVTGSNAVDHTTSGAVTANGTCAAGDTLFWRWQLDATGTTTAVATLHILGVKMEFTTYGVGD